MFLCWPGFGNKIEMGFDIQAWRSVSVDRFGGLTFLLTLVLTGGGSLPPGELPGILLLDHLFAWLELIRSILDD